MNNKDHLKKNYKSFAQFLSTAGARELEYFILDSKFTSAFNYRVKKLIEEIKQEGKKNIEFSIIFNTEGEVVLIDADILGGFISDNYTASMEKYYKDVSLNKIIKEVINGSLKAQKDFVMISCSILYRTLRDLYKDIKYKKEIVVKYGISYGLQNYEGEDLSIIVAILLIMEDMCYYLSINKSILQQSISDIISMRKI